MKNLYQPLCLSTGTDEPTFVNDQGIKWWAIDFGSEKDRRMYGTTFLMQTTSSEEAWVVISKGKPVYVSGQLEGVAYYYTEQQMRTRFRIKRG